MISKVEVSVLMAVYNAERFISDAIDSILNQTFENFELIIINDGSTDGSFDIVNSYSDDRIKIYHQKNSGSAKSRNKGIYQSKSEYIAIQDADDISNPDRLQKQYDFLVKYDDYILVGGNADIIDCEGNFIYSSNVVLSDTEIKKNIKRMPLMHPSIMFKKRFCVDVGGYPEYLFSDEDVVLINKLRNKGKMANLQCKLIKYRVSPSSLTQRTIFRDKRQEKIIHKAISHDSISDSDIQYMHDRQKYRPNKRSRKVSYHIYLMKKFLFNNYNYNYAFKNLKAAIFLNPYNIFAYLYLPLILLPSKFISIFYNCIKKTMRN